MMDGSTVHPHLPTSGSTSLSLSSVPASVTGGVTETTLPCPGSNTSAASLVWRFLGHVVLEKAEADSSYAVAKEWKGHVRTVSQAGGLTLVGLSSDKQGTYTCEVSDAEETLVNYTFVWIRQGNELV